MAWYTYSAFADEFDKDVAVQITGLKELGIPCVEPRGVNGKNVSLLTLDEAKAVKKEWDAAGIRVSAVGSPIGKITLDSPLETDLTLFRHVLELAKIFETKYIRLFSCLLPNEDDPRIHRDRVLSRMQAYVDAAKGTDCILLHENEGSHIYGQAPENCLDIFESIGSDKLRATYDAGNFAYAGFDALKAYHILADHIEYVHIKDAKSDRSIYPVGYGASQYEEILRLLKARNRHFYLSLEPHLSNFAGFSDIDGGDITLPVSSDPKEKFRLAFHCLEKMIATLD